MRTAQQNSVSLVSCPVAVKSLHKRRGSVSGFGDWLASCHPEIHKVLPELKLPGNTLCLVISSCCQRSLSELAVRAVLR